MGRKPLAPSLVLTETGLTMKKSPRIIYFIDGCNPSDKDIKAAEKLGNNVVFRNARMVPDTGCLEKCAGVAGKVPKSYKKLSTAKEAIEQAEKEAKETEKQIDAAKKAREAADTERKKAHAKAVEASKKAEAEKEKAVKKAAEAKKAKTKAASATRTPEA